MVGKQAQMLLEWFGKRLKERTTTDGMILILVGVTYLLFQPIAVYMAYAAIVYGLYTAVKQQ